MDAEMIEKVARAIHGQDCDPGGWDDLADDAIGLYRRMARAAIAALSATPQAAQVTDDDGGRDAALWSLIRIAEKCGAVRSEGGDLHWTFSVDAMCSLEKRMSDAVSAMQYAEAQPQAAQVPEGYALVPVEPTAAMRAVFRAEAGSATYFTHTSLQCADFDSRYRAMLAAAQGVGRG